MADHIGTVQAIYEAFGRGDIPAVLGHLADDVDWEADAAGPAFDGRVPYLVPRRGRDAVGGFFQALAETLEFKRFEPRWLLGGGNEVVAIIDEHFVNRTTGREIVDPVGAHLWRFGDDGKVVAFRHIADTAQHIAAAGG